MKALEIINRSTAELLEELQDIQARLEEIHDQTHIEINAIEKQFNEGSSAYMASAAQQAQLVIKSQKIADANAQLSCAIIRLKGWDFEAE